MTFLDEAVAAAKSSAEKRERLVPSPVIERAVSERGPAPQFKDALRRGGGPVRLIAEIKRMSPSAGDIRPGASASVMALEYRRGGAAAVSVVTSEYRFGGSIEDLDRASCSGVPLLRKDFIVSRYQVLESRARGASAVLLISEVLSEQELRELIDCAREAGLDALVESHGVEGLERALAAGADIVGINNRNLDTLEVDLGTTERLLPRVPGGAVVVGESGIRQASDVARLASLGVDALLIGEVLMRAPRPAEKLAELLGGEPSCG
jgi:indole-3-glycerol phosphate synthase